MYYVTHYVGQQVCRSTIEKRFAKNKTKLKIHLKKTRFGDPIKCKFYMA